MNSGLFGFAGEVLQNLKGLISPVIQRITKRSNSQGILQVSHIIEPNTNEQNTHLVLKTKGTGSLLRWDYSDHNTTTRPGDYSVDLQARPTKTGDIGGGDYSFIGGGDINWTDLNGDYQVVAGGRNNKARPNYGAICGGSSNDVGTSDVYGFIGCGLNNESSGSGYNAITAGAFNLIISGTYNFIGGGTRNKIRSSTYGGILGGAYGRVGGAGSGDAEQGKLVYATGRFSTSFDGGEAQMGIRVLRAVTTDATQKAMTAGDTTTEQNYNQVKLFYANSAQAFRALIVARRTDADNESAGYEITGVVDNNSGTMAFVGTPTVTVLAEDTAAWDVTVDIDTTNNRMRFLVTGEASKTIKWVATVYTTEVIHRG